MKARINAASGLRFLPPLPRNDHVRTNGTLGWKDSVVYQWPWESDPVANDNDDKCSDLLFHQINFCQ